MSITEERPPAASRPTAPPTDFHGIAARARAGTPATPAEGLDVLQSENDRLMELVAATASVRRKYFANRVKVNYLVNLKSGLCPEDCGYCSQRLNSGAGVLKYSWLKPDEAKRQAEFGLAGGASRVCLVASGRGPSNRDVDRVSSIVDGIKETNPQVEVCACLGILKDGQADRLRDAGVDAYNHNLNTAGSHYAEICTTHTFDDRVATVDKARTAGLSPCSGLIVGMGESDEQLIEAIGQLRQVDSDSIPVNFLIPFDGTPLAGTYELSPQKCMRILCAVRLMCPDRELRIAGGREMHLRTLQPLSLHIANSLFLGDYLTSEGQDAQDDLDMIVDGGFEIIGVADTAALRDELRAHREAHADALSSGGCESAPSMDETADISSSGADEAAATMTVGVTRPTGATGSSSAAQTLPCGKPAPAPGAEAAGGEGQVLVPTIRRRGAGTDQAPNA